MITKMMVKGNGGDDANGDGECKDDGKCNRQ